LRGKGHGRKVWEGFPKRRLGPGKEKTKRILGLLKRTKSLIKRKNKALAQAVQQGGGTNLLGAKKASDNNPTGEARRVVAHSGRKKKEHGPRPVSGKENGSTEGRNSFTTEGVAV